MAESTLSLGLTEYRNRIAFFAGYGAAYSSASAAQQSIINDIINDAYSRFLEPEGHQWSFLRPPGTLTTAANTSDYDAPDDFGSLDGEMTFSSTDGLFRPVQQVGEGDIRRWRQGNTNSGIPMFVGVQPVAATTATEGQRFKFLLYPSPAGVYTLTYPYHAYQGMLSGSFPYPLGGMQHSQTILEICLAMAEERLFDAPGIHVAAAQERLKASIARDRQNAPQNMGQYIKRKELMPEGFTWNPGVTYTPAP